ncbi:MAG: LamG domain-containing protein [Roseiflexus sp.]|nr:LamG domain-containing protein [Roseiflexus sp.]MCS7289593.1 LamG domain-containing protein [Roseiflexus sp.]MDW8231734.1 hypothetical protein [Roseiflexaceae bacterium]
MKSQRLSLILAGMMSATLIALLVMSAPQQRSSAEAQAPIFYDPPPPPTPTVAPLPSLPADLAGTQESGTILFADTFDAGAGGQVSPAWEIVDVAFVLPEDRAAWMVRDGRLAQNGTAGPTGDPRPHETLAVVGDADWTDYTISAWFYDQFNAAAGLVARRQGSNFYRFMVIANDYPVAPRVMLERVVDGKATTLASRDMPGYDRRRWYHISMTVQGARISAAINGETVLDARDPTFASGQAGLFTYALGGMLFDHVRVTTP